MSISMYDENQVKYKLIKKESILNFQKDVYYHSEEEFSEKLMSINVQWLDWRPCEMKTAPVVPGWGVGGLVGMQVGVVRSQCICPGDYHPLAHTYSALG